MISSCSLSCVVCYVGRYLCVYVQSDLACFTGGCNFVKLGPRKHKTFMRGQLGIMHELHEPLSVAVYYDGVLMMLCCVALPRPFVRKMNS